jgi:cyanophycin synthetase
MLMTDKVHPDYVLLAEHAARLFGVDIVGVDVITDDISRSFRETGACINEVQTQPAIGAQRRALGPGVPKLHEALMDSLVTPAAGHHVPIVAVTGAHAEPVARQIAAQLSARGAVVGMATRAGLDVEGRRLSADDHRGCRGLPRLVDDPMVAAIVVECQPAAVADDGLGHERVSLVVATGGDDRGDALAVLVALAEDGILSLSGDHAAAAAATIAAKTHRTVTASADALSSALGPLSAAAVEACMPALASGQVP